ncbi:hypothetical protein F5880DRAFT_141060 [Lentinula raphanica]|nr:hypothetical protein F5880DRAFT_141060 [Lentinula raphanica]
MYLILAIALCLIWEPSARNFFSFIGDLHSSLSPNFYCQATFFQFHPGRVPSPSSPRFAYFVLPLHLPMMFCQLPTRSLSRPKFLLFTLAYLMVVARLVIALPMLQPRAGRKALRRDMHALKVGYYVWDTEKPSTISTADTAEGRWLYWPRKGHESTIEKLGAFIALCVDIAPDQQCFVYHKEAEKVKQIGPQLDKSGEKLDENFYRTLLIDVRLAGFNKSRKWIYEEFLKVTVPGELQSGSALHGTAPVDERCIYAMLQILKSKPLVLGQGYDFQMSLKDLLRTRSTAAPWTNLHFGFHELTGWRRVIGRSRTHIRIDEEPNFLCLRLLNACFGLEISGSSNTVLDTAPAPDPRWVISTLFHPKLTPQLNETALSDRYNDPVFINTLREDLKNLTLLQEFQEPPGKPFKDPQSYIRAVFKFLVSKEWLEPVPDLSSPELRISLRPLMIFFKRDIRNKILGNVDDSNGLDESSEGANLPASDHAKVASHTLKRPVEGVTEPEDAGRDKRLKVDSGQHEKVSEVPDKPNSPLAPSKPGAEPLG